jgi:hypothetical protein
MSENSWSDGLPFEYIDNVNGETYWSGGLPMEGLFVSGGPGGTNTQINIGDSWKTVSGISINIGDTWKTVVSVSINIGDVWKTVF